MTIYDVEVIDSPQETKISRKGVQWCKFQGKLQNDLIEIVCFGDVAAKAVRDIGDRTNVKFDGKLDHEGVTTTLKAFGFKLAGQKARKTDQRIVKGAREAARKSHLASGHVEVQKAGRLIWRPKKECLLVSGEWKDPLEFAMDILGGQKCTEILMEQGISYHTPQSRKNLKQIEDLINLAIDVAKQDYKLEIVKGYDYKEPEARDDNSSMDGTEPQQDLGWDPLVG